MKKKFFFFLNYITFLELKQIQNVEEQIELQIKQPMEEQNGNDKNEWNNNF